MIGVNITPHQLLETFGFTIPLQRDIVKSPILKGVKFFDKRALGFDER